MLHWTLIICSLFSPLLLKGEAYRITKRPRIEKTGLILPDCLKKIPYGDDLGVVVKTKLLSLSGVFAPYNASMIKLPDGQIALFFRDDIPIKPPHRIPFHSAIKYTTLSPSFEQTSPVSVIETGSNFSEDPRAFKIGSEYFLTFNDTLPEEPPENRLMRLGKWNPKTYQLGEIISFENRPQDREKNWAPFAYKEELHFVYEILPHRILYSPHPAIDEGTFIEEDPRPTLQAKMWLEKWGIPRGGTPPLLIDGEYLTFFHSRFHDQEKVYYVMGAYTFEKDPPFKIKRFSPFPILFREIFTARHLNQFHCHLRCIFPCGAVLEKWKGKDLLHVVCGENDNAIRIVTLDYKKLKQSLIEVSFLDEEQSLLEKEY